MIPVVLERYMTENEDGHIKLKPRDETNLSVCMLIIPADQFKAISTFLPVDLSKLQPQSKSRDSLRMFFLVDDLPQNVTMCRDDSSHMVAFFSGYRQDFPAGEWVDINQTLPTVLYKDISKFLGNNPKENEITEIERPEPKGTGIPQKLKNANQWLVWEYEERDGKKTKRPLNPKTGGFTSAPDAAWSYEECKQTADRRGIGIGFSLKNGFVGIDYDHVLDTDGNLKPEYAGLMEEIQALNSYTEVSPSGEGLHIFVICQDIPPECQAGKHTERGETYSNGRYFTVTGDTWEESPSRNINTIPAEVYRRVYNRIAGMPAAHNQQYKTPRHKSGKT